VWIRNTGENMTFAIMLQVAERGEKIFYKPAVLYPWDEIVWGVEVARPDGRTKKMWAVAGNTLRGFHRIRKDAPGPSLVFRNFYTENKKRIIDRLGRIGSWEELHTFGNDLCNELRPRFTNIKPGILTPYNKLRKQIDLYFANLTALAKELDSIRNKLVEHLPLPLDSQMFSHPSVFDEDEIKRIGLKRSDSYGRVLTEDIYLGLQGILRQQSAFIGETLGVTFHPIYFDLLWNNRYKNWGGNLFETNP
jgi:hypothetical protein